MFTSACSSNDEWDELPTPIAEFVSQYFPEQSVSDYGYNGDYYHVKLKNGAGLSFDSRYKWVTVNGYGETLPAVLLFDQLPPALYEYIQENEYTGQVYSMTRDQASYTISLSAGTITYTIESGKITQTQV